MLTEESSLSLCVNWLQHIRGGSEMTQVHTPPSLACRAAMVRQGRQNTSAPVGSAAPQPTCQHPVSNVRTHTERKTKRRKERKKHSTTTSSSQNIPLAGAATWVHYRPPGPADARRDLRPSRGRSNQTCATPRQIVGMRALFDGKRTVGETQYMRCFGTQSKGTLRAQTSCRCHLLACKEARRRYYTAGRRGG
jgi:hypothetical protein